MRRALSLFLLFGALSAAALILLGTRIAGFPPLGALFDPADGLYRTARGADRPPLEHLAMAGLDGPVQVYWDDRRVPHIFAESELDGVAVMGYVVAMDRLFQMDFIPRAASGRLSEALGPAALQADRFLRATGMEWAAHRNLERMKREDGEEIRLLEAYCKGVNAYLSSIDAAELPFEFRLLGYEPDRCTPIQAVRVLQYMNFDLSYRTDEADYGILRQRLGEEAFHMLYPSEPIYSVPIIPPVSSDTKGQKRAGTGAGALTGAVVETPMPISPLLEGFLPGKGSNNWAVAGARSATGFPILAGDMHLSVTLPAIWYEVHLVTPTISSYGVTIPGAPLPVEAFNDHLAWAFTNTGSDQIDHYVLEVDPSTRTYTYEGEVRTLKAVADTIFVKGEEPVLDTLYYSHWGPVTRTGGQWIALQWTAHKASTTLAALLEMNQARTHADFQEALRKWDTPMQNVLYADAEGTISIRSTGMLPVREGGTGAGLLDGSSSDGSWTGRVPFEELPFAENPSQGFLTSTNQKPTDSAYPYYLGHDWGRTYRSIRIDSLLRGKVRHGVHDLQRYQADVHAVQRDFFVPLVDTLEGLSRPAGELRALLAGWDGETSLESRETIALHFFLDALEELTWDEEAFDAVRFSPVGDSLVPPAALPRPSSTQLFYLLAEEPSSPWLDIRSSRRRETASGLLNAALDSAAARLVRGYGEASDTWTWGRRHGLRFNHLIAELQPLGRGPRPYPGYDETLSPAADTLATHSASWRVVVDFSGARARGYGVYPGGQSGNPFSAYYDKHLDTYLNFEYFDLLGGRSADELPEEKILYSATFSSGRE